MGERKSTDEILRFVDISVLCSFREGFSNVILESMASGRPVVASHVGGNPEAIVPDITGFLFDPYDPDQLAAKILYLVRDSKFREAMGKAARQRAEEVFSLDKMVVAYEDLYQGLLNRKGVLPAFFSQPPTGSCSSIKSAV